MISTEHDHARDVNKASVETLSKIFGVKYAVMILMRKRIVVFQLMQNRENLCQLVKQLLEINYHT
jgi:hypothetical protein